MLRFSDGVNIDTSGELRSLCLRDGWYVVGEGMCIPVADFISAKEQIRQINSSKEKSNG